MADIGLVLVGVALGAILLFTALAVWLVEKTLRGEDDHDERNTQFS
ncbi:MAG: hypothetical protein ABEI96_02775 [Haloarculaceae archaeon]